MVQLLRKPTADGAARLRQRMDGAGVRLEYAACQDERQDLRRRRHLQVRRGHIVRQTTELRAAPCWTVS